MHDHSQTDRAVTTADISDKLEQLVSSGRFQAANARLHRALVASGMTFEGRRYSYNPAPLLISAADATAICRRAEGLAAILDKVAALGGQAGIKGRVGDLVAAAGDALALRNGGQFSGAALQTWAADPAAAFAARLPSLSVTALGQLADAIRPLLPAGGVADVVGADLRVQVGPMTVQYKGVARFTERDEQAGRAVLAAEGKDSRGQGSASAVVSAQLSPAGDGTTVAITTELKLTGKVAQFGRGVLAEVSQKLIGQFV